MIFSETLNGMNIRVTIISATRGWRASVLDCGGKRSATPLSNAQLRIQS